VLDGPISAVPGVRQFDGMRFAALRAAVPVWRPAFQAVVPPLPPEDWWLRRTRHRAEQPYAIPPASGGLCRLKPAFQAVALPGQAEDRRSLS